MQSTILLKFEFCIVSKLNFISISSRILSVCRVFFLIKHIDIEQFRKFFDGSLTFSAPILCTVTIFGNSVKEHCESMISCNLASLFLYCGYYYMLNRRAITVRSFII